MLSRIALITLCLTITGCDTSIETPADAVYLNGRVYTVNENNDWADAIAVRNGKIVGVGTTEELSRYRGTETDVSDLQGRMLMPGIHDMHNHPVEAGSELSVVQGGHESACRVGRPAIRAQQRARCCPTISSSGGNALK